MKSINRYVSDVTADKVIHQYIQDLFEIIAI